MTIIEKEKNFNVYFRVLAFGTEMRSLVSVCMLFVLDLNWTTTMKQIL